jgi:predicted NBD/HSP70 family sugar kinase
VLALREAALTAQTTRAVAAASAKLLVDLAHAKERGEFPLKAIGVSLPGQLDPVSGRATVSRWRNWTRVPLAQLIERDLDKAGYDIRQPAHASETKAGESESSHPAIALNGRAAALAAAEAWLGAARGKQHVVYVELGEAIETGILAEGRVLRGAAGWAGGAAWLALGESFKHEYEAQGCLAAESAKGALVRRALEEYGGESRSMLGSLIMHSPEQLTPELIVRAARGGEKLAGKVVNQACRWLGRGLANLISILNPEVIVLGGELGAALKPFIDEIRDEARVWAQPDAAASCKILPATIEENAELLGAARLAGIT